MFTFIQKVGITKLSYLQNMSKNCKQLQTILNMRRENLFLEKNVNQNHNIKTKVILQLGWADFSNSTISSFGHCKRTHSIIECALNFRLHHQLLLLLLLLSKLFSLLLLSSQDTSFSNRCVYAFQEIFEIPLFCREYIYVIYYYSISNI